MSRSNSAACPSRTEWRGPRPDGTAPRAAGLADFPGFTDDLQVPRFRRSELVERGLQRRHFMAPADEAERTLFLHRTVTLPEDPVGATRCDPRPLDSKAAAGPFCCHGAAYGPRSQAAAELLDIPQDAERNGSWSTRSTAYGLLAAP